MTSAKTFDSQGGGLLTGRLEGVAPPDLLCLRLRWGAALGSLKLSNRSPTSNPLQFLGPTHIWLQEVCLGFPWQVQPSPAPIRHPPPPTPAIHLLLDSSSNLPSLFQVLMRVRLTMDNPEIMLWSPWYPCSGLCTPTSTKPPQKWFCSPRLLRPLAFLHQPIPWGQALGLSS